MKRTLLALVAALAIVASAAVAQARPIGDSQVVAQLPAAPGYPEGIAVAENGTIWVATAARFGTSIVPPKGPPEVHAFDRSTGALIDGVVIADKDPMQDHGTSGLAFDAAGRLYVLDTQWGIIRFHPGTVPAVIDPNTHPGWIYASALPNIPPCTPLTPKPCSPTLADAPSLPNDIAFTADGTAYVTDSLQATIWRVPPGGGAPEVWFQDARLGGGFGVNGIRLDAGQTALFVTVTADGNGKGMVYRIPIANPAAMTAFHTWSLGEAPDNLAFGFSGLLYVALAGSNQVSVLEADGTELTRYSGPAKKGKGSVPWDMPSGVAIDGENGRLIVNNHSEVLGLPQHFVVFDIYVEEKGEPLIFPTLG